MISLRIDNILSLNEYKKGIKARKIVIKKDYLKSSLNNLLP
jgi:hypothetical protein